jgi:hypothetical protein
MRVDDHTLMSERETANPLLELWRVVGAARRVFEEFN